MTVGVNDRSTSSSEILMRAQAAVINTSACVSAPSRGEVNILLFYSANFPTLFVSCVCVFVLNIGHCEINTVCILGLCLSYVNFSVRIYISR